MVAITRIGRSAPPFYSNNRFRFARNIAREGASWLAAAPITHRRISMTKPSTSLQRSRAAALIAALLIPTALWAQSESPPSRAACAQAKRDAQFLRQMQLTDGDTNPFVKLPIRTDCRNVE
jgi:hypothetical protein